MLYLRDIAAFVGSMLLGLVSTWVHGLQGPDIAGPTRSNNLVYSPFIYEGPNMPLGMGPQAQSVGHILRCELLILIRFRYLNLNCFLTASRFPNTFSGTDN